MAAKQEEKPKMTVFFPKEMYERLEKLAKRVGASKGTIIRIALSKFLEIEEKERTET